MPATDAQWFKSKLDWWLGAILVAVPVLQLAALTWAIISRDRDAVYASLLGAAFVAAMYALLVVPVRYGISDDALLVHFGVVRQRIAYETIGEVYPTRNPLSSPALSLDRLAIKTGRGPLNLTLISPVQREEFLALLSSRANLRWDGSRWVRHQDEWPSRDSRTVPPTLGTR